MISAEGKTDEGVELLLLSALRQYGILKEWVEELEEIRWSWELAVISKAELNRARFL